MNTNIKIIEKINKKFDRNIEVYVAEYSYSAQMMIYESIQNGFTHYDVNYRVSSELIKNLELFYQMNEAFDNSDDLINQAIADGYICDDIQSGMSIFKNTLNNYLFNDIPEDC